MKTFLAYLEKEERQYEQILEKMKQAPENDRAVQRIAQLHQDITCLKKAQTVSIRLWLLRIVLISYKFKKGR